MTQFQQVAKLGNFTFLVDNSIYIQKSVEESDSIPTAAWKSDDTNHIILPQMASKEENKSILKTLNGPKNTDIEIDISSHIKHIKSDMVNVIFGLEDWSIEGATTAAIEIKDGSCEQTVKLVKGLVLNSDTDKECLMTGYIANHRGNGLLKISTTSHEGEESFQVEFEKNRFGGKNRGSYQNISLPIQLKKGHTVLNISLESYKAGSTDAKDCYYFIGDLKLKPKNNSDQAAKPVPRTQGDLKGLKATKEIEFYKFVIPKFQGNNDGDLIVEWSDGAKTSFSPSMGNPKFTKNYQHAVEIQFDKINSFYCLYANQSCVKIFLANSAKQYVQIPSSLYNGLPIMLTLTDASGSTVFDCIQTTPPRNLTNENLMITEGKKVYPSEYTTRVAYRLESIKKNKQLSQLSLIKQSRLSVMPIDSKSWKILNNMSSI